MSNSIDTTLKHLSNLSIVTADKGESQVKLGLSQKMYILFGTFYTWFPPTIIAHQLTSLTEKLLYTELGNQAASESDVEAIKYGKITLYLWLFPIIYYDLIRYIFPTCTYVMILKNDRNIPIFFFLLNFLEFPALLSYRWENLAEMSGIQIIKSRIF